MRHNMVRLCTAAAIAAAGMGVAAAPSQAATSHAVISAPAIAAEDTGGDGVEEDNSGKWGLAGLLGALGLAGLAKGKQVYDERRDRNANGATRAASSNSTTSNRH